MKTYRSKKGTLAIARPEFKKIEQVNRGGITTIAQRIELVAVPLLMDYEIDGNLLSPGTTKILLRGDAGLNSWAQKTLSVDGIEFVLCPESEVQGWVTEPAS